ncbi:MAG: acyl-CoA dehydratase activase [Candidatus Hodarchaeales archaeon]
MSDNSLFAGIDIGSSFTKAILINAEKKVIGLSIVHSGINLRDAAYKALEESLSTEKKKNQVKNIVTTGFGRKNAHLEDFSISNITEISCSAKAAKYLYPKDDITIIDIGGQDTKIIKIKGGKRFSFKMNRKCAAGTGTFLEELALKLRIDLKELNYLGEQSRNPVKISSYCTVFAGTEILSRIREGAKVEDMVRGAFYSIVKRVIEIDTLDNRVVLTGGVIAHNPVIVNIFEELLGKSVSVPQFPQSFVALGAAIYAYEGQNK